ncbi:MAG: family 10 glycosylhydrolase [bacterium]
MSPKRTLWISALILFSLSGVCGAGWLDFDARHIVIVRGTTSIKDSSERALANSLATQTGAWLDEVGLHHKFLTDDEVSPWRLWGARVVILPYNPAPTRLELKAFQSVIRSGGILLVFYGMDPDLASLMQVKLTPYRRAEARQSWKGFVFDQSALPGLPEIVHQSSDHLVPAVPDSGNARIIARWLDHRGQPTTEPAWVKSPSGFWMSHILQPGNDEDKKQMLLAMLATVIPDAWQKAAAQQLSEERPFGDYASLQEAEKALNPTGTLIRPASKKGGPDAALQAKVFLSDLTRRYAALPAQAPSLKIRGIWLNDSDLTDSTSWPIIEASLGSNRINTAFVRVGNSLALRQFRDLFPPSIIPKKNAHPVTLHAWLSCLSLETATGEQLSRLRAENRLQVSDTGVILPWLCPSHPANRLLLTETAATLARSGNFSGVHLDYIRYKNSSACFCKGCREQFEQGIGHVVEPWPAMALTGAYQKWRAGQITACVKAARDAVKAVNPNITVSAAVYGATPSCFFSVGQDWPTWLDSGLLDFACPMIYTSDLNTFANTLKFQSGLSSAGRIIPGLGVSSSLSRLSADQAVAQAFLVQRAGFPGYVIFEFTSGVERDVLPFLKIMK